MTAIKSSCPLLASCEKLGTRIEKQQTVLAGSKRVKNVIT